MSTRTKPRAWLTYAWADNTGVDKDTVDFIIQELEKEGIEVPHDRRELIVGQRLWDQIGQYIVDPTKSDAWIYVMTTASLSSQACQEELAIALGRALDKRTENYPLIGLVVGPPPSGLPPSLAVRLWVSTDDSTWAKQVASGVRKERASISRPTIQPFICQLRQVGPERCRVELRPRLGVWCPFFVAVREADQPRLGEVMVTQQNWSTGTGSMTIMTLNEQSFMEKGMFVRSVGGPPAGQGYSGYVFLQVRPREQIEFTFGQLGSPTLQWPVVVTAPDFIP